MDLFTFLLCKKKGGGGGVTYTLSADTVNKQIVLTPSKGDAQAITVPYATDASTVNGKDVPELENGKIPATYLPSYVDDVLEYEDLAHFPAEGEVGKIYIALDTNLIYRWGGSVYAEINQSLALGETEATAYRGDRGKIAYDHSQSAHAPSNAEANQNAFSNITVGDTTIEADSKTDTLTLEAGSNITLTPDASTDKVTITATDTTYSDATTSASGLMSGSDKTKLNGIATGAEVNQNTFSNVKIGSTTVAADSKTDTLELEAGDNIELTPDSTNDKITISGIPVTRTIRNASIASFSDGGNAPIPSLTASIEPLIGGNNNPPSSDNIKPMSGHTSMQIVDMALPANYQPSSDGKIHLAWNDGSINYDMPFNVCQTETVKDSNNNDVDVCDIESHYVLPFDCVYDEPEAIIASDTDLPAGNYYFKIVNDSWGNNNGKYVQFTLTEDLTAGKQIRKKSGGYNAAIENCTLGIFANGADKIGEALAFTVVTENPTGTSLGETDGSGDLNHWHCVVLGYNRWKYSAVRQYLNSDKAAGSWWTQQHKWDVKPAYADTKDGFLKGFDPELLHYMQVTKVTTARNNVFNSGDTPLGGMDETYDRVFLISLEQSYINPQISGEGEYWEYYKRLLGRTTPASTGATYARLIKYDLAAQTTARSRWLRSANRGNASIVCLVYASGSVYSYYAYGGYRLAPCLRIGLSALKKYTVNFKDENNNPLTVVGGQLNINNGQASVDVYPYYASYNGETLTGEWISDRDVYTEGGTPTTGAQVLNIGGTPTTYALDDVSISSLNGDNNVFASTGPLREVTYRTQAYGDFIATRDLPDAISDIKTLKLDENQILIGDHYTGGNLDRIGLFMDDYYDENLDTTFTTEVTPQEIYLTSQPAESLNQTTIISGDRTEYQTSLLSGTEVINTVNAIGMEVNVKENSSITHGIKIVSGDIRLLGSDTWDGVNTSLKNALEAIQNNLYIANYNKTASLSSGSNTIALDMTGYTYNGSDIVNVYVDGLYKVNNTDYTITVNDSTGVASINYTAAAAGTMAIQIIKPKIGFTALTDNNGDNVTDSNGNSIDI